MNACTLIDQLKKAIERHGPLTEVVVASNETYFDFVVKKHTGLTVTDGQSDIVALDVTNEVTQYIVTVQE